MDVAEAQRIVARQHDGKIPYGPPLAREVAKVYTRDLGVPIEAYSCGTCGRWHIGHPLSLESMQNLAMAIRVLGHGLGPTTDE